jgi:hypothetical protein
VHYSSSGYHKDNETIQQSPTTNNLDNPPSSWLLIVIIMVMGIAVTSNGRRGFGQRLYEASSNVGSIVPLAYDSNPPRMAIVCSNPLLMVR